MQQPCKRDCPGRSPTCHATCEAYKAYEAERHAHYDDNSRHDPWCDVHRLAMNKYIRDLKRRRK